jgi:diguanylate cyclase (GGDEF)-like protein
LSSSSTSDPVGDELFDSTLEVTIARDMRAINRVASAQQALLLVLSGQRLGTRCVLADKPIDIGRESSVGLVLDADSVSRRHARVEQAPNGYRLTDLGSTNGTYVNGMRVKEHMLRDGDRIQIGKTLIKYIAGGNIEGAYHEEIQRLMHFDGLTGVHNKRHFDDQLQMHVSAAHAEHTPLSLIVFDIDHFKKVNDGHGHMAGDAVLCTTASVVQYSIPKGMLFARVGGEEFAVVCPRQSLSGARTLAEQIRNGVANNRPNFEGKVHQVTVSLGVAELVASESPEALYKRADERLYEAKNSGRNRVAG